ncbi:MAG TPA: isocitrate/isopropylmalate family dehydrogenase, partial [Lentisphaeria bacterium]|nr:isocitrate/isopropylmalate family dehydrogenase [Lentisphaeria bacterium]
MTYNIAVVAGDGIGPEIIDASIRVAEAVAPGRFQFNYVIAGGKSIDEFGVPLTDETLAVCRQSDSVLLGAVGGPKWDGLPGHLRPERALLGLRKELGLFANIRPARLIPVLKDACPL